MTGPVTAIANGYRHAIDLKGHSTRSEFWWFWGFGVLVGGLFEGVGTAVGIPLFFVVLVVLAVFMVPISTCLVRRIRDAGRHSFWAAPWTCVLILACVFSVLNEDGMFVVWLVLSDMRIAWYGLVSALCLASVPGLVFSFLPTAPR